MVVLYLIVSFFYFIGAHLKQVLFHLYPAVISGNF